MGILSTLAKIGGIAAAPFTGGLSTALTAAGSIGDVLSKQAKGAADGRMTEAELLQRQDALKNQQYGIAQNAQMQAGQQDLQRKDFTEQARSGRAKQALVGDLLSRLQDVQINVPGIKTAQISGGLRPSAIGDDGRAGMAELVKQALAAQMAGDTFEGGKILTAPQLSTIPQASGWEKAAGIGGILGTLGGTLGSILPERTSEPPDVPYYMQPPQQTGLSDIYKKIKFGD